jgi:hypothetical protein
MTGNPSSSSLARSLAPIVRATEARHRQAFSSDVQCLYDRGLRSVRDLRNVLLKGTIDPETRRVSCWAIGRLRPPGWIRLLGAAVKTDPDPNVVNTATHQLLQHDTNVVRRVFREALITGRHSVNRAAGAWALGALHVERATRLLIDVASSADEAIEVRAEATEALGYMRESSPVEALIRLLDDRRGEVRCEAAFSLGNLGDVRALPFLKKLAKDNAPCANLGRLSEVAAQASRQIRMWQRVGRRTPRPRSVAAPKRRARSSRRRAD